MAGKYHGLIKGYPLIKFKSKELIESLRNGHMYFSSLSVFREYEDASGIRIVGDEREGMMPLQHAVFEDARTHERTPVNNALIKTRNSDDYVFCFFGMKENTTHFTFSEEQKAKIREFGDTALVILDYGAFEDRVKKAAKDAGFEVHFGRVDYYDDEADNADTLIRSIYGMWTLAFEKPKDYEYQQEYRFLLERKGRPEDHWVLELGSLEDISRMISTEQALAIELNQVTA